MTQPFPWTPALPPAVASAGAAPQRPQFKLNAAAADTLAKAEAMKLGQGDDLERDGREKEHGRHQTFRDHINLAAMLVFWFIVVTLAWGIAAYAWHLLMPEPLHYLDRKQLDRVETILVAALFSSALSGYVNKRMS